MKLIERIKLKDLTIFNLTRSKKNKKYKNNTKNKHQEKNKLFKLNFKLKLKIMMMKV